MYQNVEICGHDAKFTKCRRFIIVHLKRREQNRILEREIVLGIIVHALQQWCSCLSRATQSFVPAAIERKVTLNEARKLGTCCQTQALLMITYPAMKFGPDEVEILRHGTTLALANTVRVLAAKP